MGNLVVISFVARNQGFGNIKVVAETPYGSAVHMAVREGVDVAAGDPLGDEISAALADRLLQQRWLPGAAGLLVVHQFVRNDPR